ncbi:hypothetical protein [Sphingomonas sp.]|uniref:hypothetical protein n=1 Tax=Sphingomonas sp. TaxID=28214 RepID=UPI003CC6CF1F
MTARTPAVQPAPQPPAAPIEEQPQEGGSYLREGGGSLTRVAFTDHDGVPPAPETDPAQPAAEPLVLDTPATPANPEQQG